ncbi:TetR family transcriptional regulator [Epidermidibacterium keratini]|uniref:TetR family transcriptional regulator n=1 Tax=Epidermidibacterium keratini TaxID=1891644 RepID=A0A7L4YRY3_9ACTN|nr:TetR/AcrR family transcriptional regulator [Epidermidibacterium keratini]QHC01822.1 TetR family transcriptional regulator [Epidermidibacterium keratini]
MSTRGRPRGFDRDAALLTATRLFWARGYDGTSLSDLTAAMGISPSSFYAAFGDKKSLFAETVQGYMQRYTAIYIEAVRSPTAREAAERILRDSVDEFTDENRPMSCLVVSAAIQGGSETIDVRRTLEEHQRALETVLAERIEQDKVSGALDNGLDTAVLTGWVRTVWEGLSNQSNAGVAREQLQEIVTLAMRAWPG